VSSGPNSVFTWPGPPKTSRLSKPGE